MSEGMHRELEQQIERLLAEAERAMRAEEILPHLDPVMPNVNDIADALQQLTYHGRVARDGSFFSKPTPVPVDSLFTTDALRNAARTIVEIIRELDADANGEGARLPQVIGAAKEHGIPQPRALDVVAVLRNAGEAYSVGGDRLRLAKS